LSLIFLKLRIISCGKKSSLNHIFLSSFKTLAIKQSLIPLDAEMKDLIDEEDFNSKLSIEI